MKFKWKLFLSYLIIVLVPFLVAERYIASHLRHRLLKQTEERLFKEAVLVKTIVEKTTSEPFEATQIDPLIKEMGRKIDARITFIDSRGVVRGDTGVPFEKLSEMEDHSRRPEFIAAFRNTYGVASRYSTTLHMDMMYLAVKIRPHDDFLGVVRVALPLTEVKNLIARTDFTLVLAFLLCAALILALNIIASKRLSQPIEEITQAAKAISAGDYNVKLYTGGKGQELETLGQSVNTMAQEIKKRVREITQEKEKLNTILRSMSDGVMVVDKQGNIILMNSSLEHLFGDIRTTGKPPVEVIRNAQLQDGVSSVLESGKSFNMELSLATAGSDKVFDVTVSRLMPEKKVEGAVAVFHDITDLKRINKVRKDFVANVSHELRTPLTSIKGYAETICHGKLDGLAKAKSFAEIILKHANRLSALVEDLLSLTRFESAQNLPEKIDINLQEVLDAAILVVKQTADAKGLQIHTEGVPEKFSAWADRGQVSQALINLLDNAVKYTPEGGTITVRGEDKGDEIHVTVQDTGIGIPREDLDRIFERFYRVDKNRSRDMGGTGLGLSIVKHIIQGHGGKVWVKSRMGEGSAFTFSLPKKS
jgi:two-component system, OmpR family, phosphate regulon sensor histidine kinase PhoR